MNRFAYRQLLNWKKCSNNNLLILGGVLSVGKTSLIKEFMQREFSNDLYLDMKGVRYEEVIGDIDSLTDYSVVVFDNIWGDRSLLKNVYDLSKKEERLYFIFIDPFVKEGKGYHNIISARYLILTPLSFEEFLFNVNKELFEALSNINSLQDITPDLNNSLLDIYTDYLYTGGMPSVVEIYIEKGICDDIRKEQKRLLNLNYDIISNYYNTASFKNLKKIINTIFPTLNRYNQKFKLTDISPSRRFTTFKGYFDVLEHLNLIYRSYCVTGDSIKIKWKSFVLYFFDTGLLGLIGKVPYKLFKSENLLKEPKILSLVHNSIATEIFSHKVIEVYHWSNNTARVEFLIKRDEHIAPIEIKDDSSGKLKSLDVFRNHYTDIKEVRLNLNLPDKRGHINTYPLYLANNLVRRLTNLN